MSKYIDVKTTVWERWYIPDDVVIPENEFDIQDFLDDNEFWDWENEAIIETSEWMSVDQNDGEATIEVFDENGKLICDNGEI